MKRIVAKTGSYTKDGEQKSQWTRVGVIMSNDNGEYVLLDPTVDLAGVMMKQRLLAAEGVGKAGSAVMCSVFTDEPQPSPAHQAAAAPPSGEDFDDIPF